MQKAAGNLGLAREFRDVFELEGVPAYRQFYDKGIFVWKALYRGSYAPWHLVPAPTIANPGAMRQMYRLNAAKAVSAELAGLVWGEQCGIRVSMKGGSGEEEDPLNAFVARVLEENCFAGKMQQLIEQGLALGGAAIKVWFEPEDAGEGGRGTPTGAARHLPTAVGRLLGDEAGDDGDLIRPGRRPGHLPQRGRLLEGEEGGRGNPTGAARHLPTAVGRLLEGEESGHIRLGYCMADQFVPLSWDNARVTEGVFISRRAKDGYYYTRLEWHRWTGGGQRVVYAVDNELYRAEMPQGNVPAESQDILGVRVPLGEAFPRLEAHTEATVGESLFTYWRTPVANNLDDNSPLGVSIYGNALETLHALDICYDSFVNEFRLGKKRIIVPARCVRTVVDPGTGAPRRYFDPHDEVYEAFASDEKDDLRIQDSSVELRVEEHVAALNAFLSVLCLQLGFSANTFSFDERGGIKTATEVVSENSKTFKTIRTVQNQLVPALEQLARNIIEVAALYGVRWQGRSVAELAAGGYEVKVTFDDGVTQDRQTNIREGVALVNAGLLSRTTFLTDRKYGQGLTEEEARRELERIREERRMMAGDAAGIIEDE